MNLLLIHQAFVSPGEAGGTRHYEFARYLVEQGHRFTVVASTLSYLSGQRTIESKRLIEEQTADDVRILRAYAYPALHKSFAWRVISFLSFMMTSTWAGLCAGPIDLVMGTSPPIFQAVSAWLVAFLRRRPFLLEVRDLWPEFAIDMGVLRNPVLIALSRRLVCFLYARARHIVVNSPAYRDYLIEKGILAAKTTLIPNGVDTTMFSPQVDDWTVREQFGIAGKFVVTYTGALGMANDIGTILDAADLLRHHDNIHFLLVGDGKERANLEARARDLLLTNVTFAGSHPKTAIPDFLAASDICVAILQDIPMFRTTYPNKVFDYMAAGRPTVLAIDGVIREVVEAAEGGVFVPPGNPSALADAIRSLSTDPDRVRSMGNAVREYVIRHFDRQKQAEQFADLVQKLSGAREQSAVLRSSGDRIKRGLDLTLAALVLILLSPVMMLLGILVRLRLGRPVLFSQQRPGLHGEPFMLLKFRTMTDARDVQGNLLPDADRLTPLGRFLRRASLDELPTLINVLRGEMSLVGPRPLLMQYLERYTPEQGRRHDVRPGITGWAQVNGRNAISWEEKFALDVWYIEHHNLWLDLKILLLTVWKVLKWEGISQADHATMSEFMGGDQPGGDEE